jgi:hypothetical protein
MPAFHSHLVGNYVLLLVAIRIGVYHCYDLVVG